MDLAVTGRLQPPRQAEVGRSWVEALLGPISLETFVTSYWEQKHLFGSGCVPSGCDDLLSISELDAFLSRNDVRYPAVQVVKGGRNIPLASYAHHLRLGSYSSEGLIDMDLVAQEYRGGGTVVVQLMQNSFPRLAEFSSALGAFFRSKVDVHAFLTPPAAQGLLTHYDAASAFLIQLRGKKRWRLYEMEIEAPAPDQTFDVSKPIGGDPIDEVNLCQGDVLYLPRGLPHEGVTQESDSLHLTVVLFPNSWIDILSAVLKECQGQEDFRKAFIHHLLDTKGTLPGDIFCSLVKDYSSMAASIGREEIENVLKLVSPTRRRGRWI